MKFLLVLLLFTVSCAFPQEQQAERKNDKECQDGYLVFGLGSDKKTSGFCREAAASEGMIKGWRCYNFPYMGKGVEAERLILQSGWYAKTKCYNPYLTEGHSYE